MQRVVCLLAVYTMLIAGCGVDWFPVTSPDAPATITVAASPSSPVVGAQVTIEATVKKADGTAVTDGTTVSFTITTGGGSLASNTATTIGGIAKTTLNGPSTAGSVTVTASSGNVNNTVTVSYGATIKFTPIAANLSASAGGTTSFLVTVLNAAGTANAGAAVTFSTATTGVTLAPLSATTDANGDASVNLTVNPGVLISGTVITITATQGSNSASATVTMI